MSKYGETYIKINNQIAELKIFKISLKAIKDNPKAYGPDDQLNIEKKIAKLVNDLDETDMWSIANDLVYDLQCSKKDYEEAKGEVALLKIISKNMNEHISHKIKVLNEHPWLVEINKK